MTKIVHLKDVKKANLTKLELHDAIELINQELLDWISSGAESAIDQLQRKSSEEGEAHRETRRKAEEILKWRGI